MMVMMAIAIAMVLRGIGVVVMMIMVEGGRWERKRDEEGKRKGVGGMRWSIDGWMDGLSALGCSVRPFFSFSPLPAKQPGGFPFPTSREEGRSVSCIVAVARPPSCHGNTLTGRLPPAACLPVLPVLPASNTGIGRVTDGVLVPVTDRIPSAPDVIKSFRVLFFFFCVLSGLN